MTNYQEFSNRENSCVCGLWSWCEFHMLLFLSLDVFAVDKIQFMKWPLRFGGATFLRNVTDTVQTVQYSDSQCTQ